MCNSYLEMYGNKCAICGKEIEMKDGYHIVGLMEDMLPLRDRREMRVTLCKECGEYNKTVDIFPQYMKYIKPEIKEAIKESINKPLSCSFKGEYGDLGKAELGIVSATLSDGYSICHARCSDFSRFLLSYEVNTDYIEIEDSLNEAARDGSFYILTDSENTELAIFPVMSMGKRVSDTDGSEYTYIEVVYPLFPNKKHIVKSGEMLKEFIALYQSVLCGGKPVFCRIRLEKTDGIAESMEQAGYVFEDGDLILTLE